MKKIWQFLKRLFTSLKKLAEKYVTPSVLVVEEIKRFIDGPVIPIITEIIPGNLDSKIIDKIKKELPRVLQILRISEECLQYNEADKILECALRKLKEYNPEARAAQFHSIAALLSVALSDKKITWREAVHLAEETFQQIKK